MTRNPPSLFNQPIQIKSALTPGKWELLAYPNPGPTGSEQEVHTHTNLMLKLGGIPRIYRNNAAVHVQLPHNGTAAFQLRTERLLRTLAQPK